MPDPIEIFYRGEHRVELYHDDDPALNPRRDCDNFGTMVCWHPNYDLGDEHSYDDMDSVYADLCPVSVLESSRAMLSSNGRNLLADPPAMAPGTPANKYLAAIKSAAQTHAFILPLYLYDHGGLTMATKPFDCRWDSAQVGLIFATRDTALKDFGQQRMTYALSKKVYRLLEDEVTTYDQLLRGDIYGYGLFGPGDQDPEDGCWGFFGFDLAKTEAKAALDCFVDSREAPAS